MRIKKTKHGDYEKVVAFDAWLYTVHIIITDNLERSCKARWGETAIGEAFVRLYTKTDKAHRRCEICFQLDQMSVGLIAHECWHVVRDLLMKSGAECDDETVAYHLGYLVTQVVNAWVASRNISQGKEGKQCRAMNGSASPAGAPTT